MGEMPTDSPTPEPTPQPTPPTEAPTMSPTPPPTPLPAGMTWAPTPEPTPTCDTVSDCANNKCTPERYSCYKDVKWAMEHGIRRHPAEYSDCTIHSSFECFQMSLFRVDRNRCSSPPC